VAFLSSALAGARAWSECALSLAFPWPESNEAEPKPVVAPFCERCGYPYEHVPGGTPFECSNCADHHWHFAWARAGYLTEGQVHEAVVGFKYHDEFFRLSQLTGWLTEAFDRHAAGEKWDALVPAGAGPRPRPRARHPRARLPATQSRDSPAGVAGARRALGEHAGRIRGQRQV
jgi:hypothetical protein